MECNEQTELKENGDRLIDGEKMIASGGSGEGVEGLSKKEKGFINVDNSGDCWVERV